MDITPDSPRTASLKSDSSWLLLAPKPYYNPANLEKAGTRVKQKEFVQRIGFFVEKPRPPHLGSRTPCRHIFLRAARLGSARLALSSAHPKPLPLVHRSRRPPA